MLDFDKNDYEVRDKGTDFWGNKKYELIEKPKGGGCLGIIVLIIFFFIYLGNDSDNSSDNSIPNRVQKTMTKSHLNDNETCELIGNWISGLQSILRR